MSWSRTSLESAAEQEKYLEAARSLQDTFEKESLKLVANATAFHSYKLEVDGEENSLRDPAIVSSDVAAQMSFLRKLKFQYLEQNAKDRYVKTIVSDIDDAPMVTADDNSKLSSRNEQKKAKLREAKVKLAEVQGDIVTLAPLVEEDYNKIKKATEKATMLAQKIIDAKLALSRLRQTHPHPRLTIPLADQKLAEQVEKMQTLHDEVQAISKNSQNIKERVKGGGVELEKLRMERAEAEKAVKLAKVDEDDGKLIPLYDWYTASLALHRSIHNLHESHAASENELRLTYNVAPSPSEKPILLTITLIFAPDTRHLAAVQVSGLEEVDLDVGDVIDTHIQTNDMQGVIAAILSHVRTTLALRAS
ncbi:hypothetical protein AX17_007507 [Amanita inopinata Kibby_2008]|nr:hypothetical protein AX17_007507 [Amanita inopinata Kibby_2008]